MAFLRLHKLHSATTTLPMGFQMTLGSHIPVPMQKQFRGQCGAHGATECALTAVSLVQICCVQISRESSVDFQCRMHNSCRLSPALLQYLPYSIRVFKLPCLHVWTFVHVECQTVRRFLVSCLFALFDWTSAKQYKKIGKASTCYILGPLAQSCVHALCKFC